MLEGGELSYYGREGAVQRLEDAFAELVGVEHALGVSSGTAALHSAYFGLGLGPGDEVLVPTYTFLATVMPLFVVNAVPVLVDAESDTGNIDADDLERRITPASRAVVVTHMWGSPCDMERIAALCCRHGLALIEDCSHAHGATCAGQPVGSFGDAAAFSLQGKKLVAAGQGGMLLTRHQEVYERATLLGHFRVRAFQTVTTERYRSFAGTGYGLNYRMHPLAAAIAEHQLERLDEYVSGRQANFERLSDALHDIAGVDPPPLKPYVTRRVHYSYKPQYRAEELGGVPIETYVAALAAEGVAIERSETLPLHTEPIFQVRDHGMRCHGFAPEPTGHRQYASGDLPASEYYALRALAITPFTDPAPDLMDQYAEAFAKVGGAADELLEYSSR
jgi:dTDP-4-amino-4,6-dideoxygalactose transaminase